MMERSAPPFMEAIRQGIEASGRALLSAARDNGQPLVTWRDGRVLLVDADGIPVALDEGPAEPR